MLDYVRAELPRRQADSECLHVYKQLLFHLDTSGGHGARRTKCVDGGTAEIDDLSFAPNRLCDEFSDTFKNPFLE